MNFLTLNILIQIVKLSFEQAATKNKRKIKYKPHCKLNLSKIAKIYSEPDE